MMDKCLRPFELLEHFSGYLEQHNFIFHSSGGLETTKVKMLANLVHDEGLLLVYRQSFFHFVLKRQKM